MLLNVHDKAVSSLETLRINIRQVFNHQPKEGMDLRSAVKLNGCNLLACNLVHIKRDLNKNVRRLLQSKRLTSKPSLVATHFWLCSVPGLDNLHLMSQFVNEFVDDPVVTPFNEILSYQPGFNEAIVIIVSAYTWVAICSISIHTYIYALYL